VLKYGYLSGEFNVVRVINKNNLLQSVANIDIEPVENPFSNWNINYKYIDSVDSNLYIKVTVFGNNENKFEDIEGLNFNQKETAKALDSLVVLLKEEEVSDLTSAIEVLMKMDNEKLKQRLSDLSGHFLSDVIMNKGYHNVRRGVYGQLGNYENTDKNIWGEVGGAIMDIKDKETSYKFRLNNGVILAGVDMMAKSKGRVGFFCKAGMSDIKEEKDKGKVNSYGVGVYGGIEEEKMEVKGLICGDVDKYETSRMIAEEGVSEDVEIKGDFGGVSCNIDIEGCYKIPLLDSEVMGGVELKPYIGSETIIINTKGFEESNKMIGLKVEGNTYVKSGIRAGVGIKGEKERLKWNIGGGINCVLTGREGELNSKMIASENYKFENPRMKSRSISLGMMEFECELGGRYKVSNNIDIYAGMNVVTTSNYSDLNGNVGLRYAFANWPWENR
jgi:outer membrane autotransporter protein